MPLPIIHNDLVKPTESFRLHHRAAPFDGSAGAAPGVDRSDIVALLRQNCVRLVFAAIVGGGLGVAASTVLPKRYLAEGLLVIDTREINIPEFQSIRSARTVEPWGGRSEARVLSSREMVSAIVTKFDLQHDPNYNTTLQASPLSEIPWLPESWREELRPEPEFGPRAQTRIVQQFLRNLTVLSEERSYAITVRYTGFNPIQSAELLNALMDYYLSQDVRAKSRAVDQARTELKQRLEHLHSDLEQTRARIRSLEGEPGALETNQGTVTAQVTVAVALERLHLAAEQGSVKTDLAQLSSALASNRISVINEKLVTPRLKLLWENEATAQRILAELGLSAAPTYPRMRQLQTGLNKVQLEIRNEVAAIRDGLQQRLTTLKLRDDALKEQLSRDRIVGSTSATDRALLNQLKADATSKQTLYDQYRNRYEQTVANAELLTPDARVVSYAEPAIRPSYPSLTARALIGGLIGLLAAVATIIARRWLGDRVETLYEAQQICGVTALGGIPQVGSWIKPTSVTDMVIDEPLSALSTAIRGILYQITFSRATRPLKVVMVTSPVSQAGKSSLVAAMVRIGTRDGLRCLAIDCDFYRPSLAQKINVKPPLYLNDSISREPAPSELIVEDPVSGAHFILAKPSSEQTSPLPRNSTRVALIIEAVRQNYDLIVIDTPQSLAVIDPLLLSRMADGMVLVLPWRAMSHRRVVEAMQRLANFDCPLIGVVLSRIGGRAHPDYEYVGYTQTKA